MNSSDDKCVIIQITWRSFRYFVSLTECCPSWPDWLQRKYQCRGPSWLRGEHADQGWGWGVSPYWSPHCPCLRSRYKSAMFHPDNFSKYHSLMLSRCYCGVLWAWHGHAAHHSVPQRCHVTVGVWAHIVKTLRSGVRAPTEVRDGASVTHAVLWGWSNGWGGGGDNVPRGEGVHWAGWGGAVHEGALQQVHWGKSLLSRVIQHTALELD